MKVLEKKIKDCKNQLGQDEKVLEIQYSHKWERWEVFIRDYNESMYTKILKQLRVEISNAYINYKTMKAHSKERVKV